MTIIEDRPSRGAITEFSRQSRANMVATLASLDYSPMFASGNPTAMVTLTLPGRDWEQLVPDLRTFKRMLASFQRAYARAWGSMPVAVWKMEFQMRGAPHAHLFLVPPTGLSRGRGVRGGRRFHEWLSITWALIVDRGADVERPSERFRDHVRAGTGVDYVEGRRFSDPRRIAAYFSKHGQFIAKDYQNEIPEHWRDAILEDGRGGARFWGYWGLEKAVEVVELSSERRPSARGFQMGEDGPVRHRHATPSPVDLSGETGKPIPEIMSVRKDSVCRFRTWSEIG